MDKIIYEVNLKKKSEILDSLSYHYKEIERLKKELTNTSVECKINKVIV